MKPLHLTPHAAARMLERGLTPEIVEAIVRQPDWVEPDPDDTKERRFGRPPGFTRYVRVVCVEEEDHIRVVSAFSDRNARPPNAS